MHAIYNTKTWWQHRHLGYAHTEWESTMGKQASWPSIREKKNFNERKNAEFLEGNASTKKKSHNNNNKWNYTQKYSTDKNRVLVYARIAWFSWMKYFVLTAHWSDGWIDSVYRPSSVHRFHLSVLYCMRAWCLNNMRASDPNHFWLMVFIVVIQWHRCCFHSAAMPTDCNHFPPGQTLDLNTQGTRIDSSIGWAL